MLRCWSRPNGTDHFLFGLKRPIKLAEAPQDATVRSRITPVECVAVVEVDDCGEGVLRILSPVQNRFAPSHSHVVVQFALHQQRLLSRIPEFIFRFPASQLFPRVNFFAMVGNMSLQRFSSPIRNRRPLIVILAIETKRIRQLAPDQQLVQILLRTRIADFGSFASNAKRRNHPVVQIRRHATDTIDQRVVSLLGISRQLFFLKRIPPLIGGDTSANGVNNWANSMVDLTT